MATQSLRSARRNYRLSALIARRAVTEARRARPRGTVAVGAVVVAHQIANAQTSQTAIAQMLAEQDIVAPVDALLNLAAFTTDQAGLDRMLAEIDRKAAEMLDQLQVPDYMDAAFDRLVASMVQDAGRAAESVAVAVRQDVYWTRFVNPPCCARCAILAGRRYRWSDDFKRHPGCDCSMLASGEQSPYVLSPDELLATGQVRGLSKTDMKALADGADLNRVVNVRLKKAGLLEAGQGLSRGGRPTPAGIYRLAGDDRAKAVELLKKFGFIL